LAAFIYCAVTFVSYPGALGLSIVETIGPKKKIECGTAEFSTILARGLITIPHGGRSVDDPKESARRPRFKFLEAARLTASH
jgi:hypothetical protein